MLRSIFAILFAILFGALVWSQANAQDVPQGDSINGCAPGPCADARQALGGRPIASTSCQATAAALNSPVTVAKDCTGVNLIVINYASAVAPSSITDSSSNVYTIATCGTSVGNQCLYYKYNPTVTNSMTFTANGAGIAASIQVVGFRNVRAVALDKDAGQTQNGSAGTTCQTPSLSPTSSNELIVSGFFANTDSGGSTYTADSGMTVLFNPFTGGVNYGGGLSYITRYSNAAIQPTWTDSTAAGSMSCNLIATR